MNNIIKLLKYYFIKNFKRDIWYFAIIALIAFTTHYIDPSWQGTEYAVAVVLMLYYAARSFRELANPAQCLQTLLLPASNAEKVTAKILLVNVYFVAGSLVVISLGNLLGWLAAARDDVSLATALAIPLNADQLLWLYLLAAVLFFTSIYFKGKKTLSKPWPSFSVCNSFSACSFCVWQY